MTLRSGSKKLLSYFTFNFTGIKSLIDLGAVLLKFVATNISWVSPEGKAAFLLV